MLWKPELLGEQQFPSVYNPLTHFIDILRERIEHARIVVIASHADSGLRDLCDKGLLFDQERIKFAGTIDDVLSTYRLDYVNAK